MDGMESTLPRVVLVGVLCGVLVLVLAATVPVLTMLRARRSGSETGRGATVVVGTPEVVAGATEGVTASMSLPTAEQVIITTEVTTAAPTR